jgi:hypothetical protein
VINFLPTPWIPKEPNNSIIKAIVRLSLMKKAEVKLGGGEDTTAANHPQTVVSSW